MQLNPKNNQSSAQPQTSPPSSQSNRTEARQYIGSSDQNAATAASKSATSKPIGKYSISKPDLSDDEVKQHFVDTFGRGEEAFYSLHPNSKEDQIAWIEGEESLDYLGLDQILFSLFSCKVNDRNLVRVPEMGTDQRLHSSRLRPDNDFTPRMILSQAPNKTDEDELRKDRGINRFVTMLYLHGGGMIAMAPRQFDWGEDTPSEFNLDGEKAGLKVEKTNTTEVGSISIENLDLSFSFPSAPDKNRTISVLSVKNWSDRRNGGAISNTDDFKALMDQAKEIYKKMPEEKELVIHCAAGLGRTGAVAACLLLEQMDDLTRDNLLEKIDLVIDKMRRERSHGVVQKKEQYLMIYRYALEYLVKK